MSDPLGKLFFPLSKLRVSRVLLAGDQALDFVASKRNGQYSGIFLKNGKEVKPVLEKIDQDSFTRGFLHYFYFREPEKRYNAARKFLARMGVHNKEPMAMTYVDQKYKFKFLTFENGTRQEIQLFYSPVVEKMVIRGLDS